MLRAKNKNQDFEKIQEKARRLEALIRISKDIQENEKIQPISFNDFLFMASEEPDLVFRNIFQLFYDMIKHYIGDGEDDFEVTEDSVGFVKYNCTDLFYTGCDDPFFADRLFANRFMNLVEGFKKGIENNRIYLFEGPPGSGKSTFLNNLLLKLEEYSKTRWGTMYETLWKLDIEKIKGSEHLGSKLHKLAAETNDPELSDQLKNLSAKNKYLEIGCPNHDHPILQVPKSFRKKFLDELIPSKQFKEKLFNTKEYEWVLKDNPCSICTSIYTHLFEKVGDPMLVFNMVNARRMTFNRKFGIGVSVFNPGDQRMIKPISNPNLQKSISDLLKTDDIKYIYSDLANTNNGVMALMDIKENNIERLKSLHGIISDGVHKVETIEEKITSLFMGLVNPEDKIHFENVKSFQDRIITTNIPYILDYNTEVEIYQNKFGKKLESWFLPRVLKNFAKIIISSRLNTLSPAIEKWLSKPEIYSKYQDRNFLLLKMDIYTGKIPDWLTEEDLRRFSRQVRKDILGESESEGKMGFSGRQSLSVFNSFLLKNAKQENLFTMDLVTEFFDKMPELKKQVPDGFIESLVHLYDYNVLQEVKESVYYYNEKQISRDILNYIYAVNFDPGTTINCEYTGDVIDLDEDYFKNIEAIFLGTTSTLKERRSYRDDIQTEYITNTLSQDIKVKGKKITDTELYTTLFQKYTRNLKENALAPYNENKNFRNAIMDFGNESFKKYDSRLRRDVTLLISNLQTKFGYNQQGAIQLSVYVLDKDLAKKY
ncbi:MAG: hypothetical protein JXR58_04055 [Bacteroidales bacterium]|nr:hypothetical protein [Bacteroidales bacterium]